MNTSTQDLTEEQVGRNIDRRMAQGFVHKDEVNPLQVQREGLDRKRIARTVTGEAISLAEARGHFDVDSLVDQMTIVLQPQLQADRAKRAEQQLQTIESDEQQEQSPDDKSLQQLLRELAETIFAVLHEHQHAIDVIKSDSIGPKTTDQLGERGDLNFLVDRQAGKQLYERLAEQGIFNLVPSPNPEAGFILKSRSEQFDLKIVFVFAEYT